MFVKLLIFYHCLLNQRIVSEIPGFKPFVVVHDDEVYWAEVLNLLLKRSHAFLFLEVFNAWQEKKIQPLVVRLVTFAKYANVLSIVDAVEIITLDDSGDNSDVALSRRMELRVVSFITLMKI